MFVKRAYVGCKCGNSLSILQLPVFLSSCSTSTQVSFRGLIVSRELRQSDSPSQRLPNELVEVPKFGPVKISAIKDLQLGFTLLKNTIIQLRVRDLESPNTISVYLDLRRTTYIGGILPGKYCVNKFVFLRNLMAVWKISSVVYFQFSYSEFQNLSYATSCKAFQRAEKPDRCI